MRFLNLGPFEGANRPTSRLQQLLQAQIIHFYSFVFLSIKISKILLTAFSVACKYLITHTCSHSNNWHLHT